MNAITVGNKVLLNSLKDFSQDQAKRDWTDKSFLDKVLVVNGVYNHRLGGHPQINFENKRYTHAANRFALIIQE